MYSVDKAALAQDLLARGMTFSPAPVFGNFFGGRRDLTFGIYGRADEARKLLDEKWSGEHSIRLFHPAACIMLLLSLLTLVLNLDCISYSGS